MDDQNRSSDDRYGDRYRQDDRRTEDYRTGESYGRSYGQDRSRYGGDAYAGGGQRYGRSLGDSRGYEDRSFAGERGYESYGAYGDDVYRDGRYGADPRDSQRYDNREASGAMLHQGYRAPFAGVRGDAQSFSNVGYTGYGADYGRGGYRGHDARIQGGQHPDERGWWDQTRDEVSSWFGDDQAAQRRQQDDLRHGQHGGRGPKGYTRSDDRIREDVNDRLTYDHALDASDIDVKVSNGEVTLGGHVESRQAKRRAEDIADRISGVKHVQNNLRVIEHQTVSSFATSGGTSGQSAPGSQSTAVKSN